MNDDELHRLLRQHPARAQLASSFDREVWSRIEAESTRTLGSLLADFTGRALALLARPSAAAATLVVFAVNGFGFGWYAHQKELESRAAVAYQQAVNPLYRAGWEAGR